MSPEEDRQKPENNFVKMFEQVREDFKIWMKDHPQALLTAIEHVSNSQLFNLGLLIRWGLGITDDFEENIKTWLRQPGKYEWGFSPLTLEVFLTRKDDQNKRPKFYSAFDVSTGEEEFGPDDDPDDTMDTLHGRTGEE
jgi:hypothetical protein